jgi:dethiobiotin synthetase
VKPFCSGGRDDARLLRRAQNNDPALNLINPWHFQAPIAPLLAARRERRKVSMRKVLNHLIKCAAECELLLIEGAGGLLSPLGEGFDARDLILELRATPVVVSANRLGTVNQVRLVLAALPKPFADSARVALMEFAPKNQATRTNLALLGEYVSSSRIAVIPRIKWPDILGVRTVPSRLDQVLRDWRFRTDT